MKFNWGTGIFSFIILFLIICAIFIVFTFKQGVNLVHEDYYEKGSDHSEQMLVLQRSAHFKDDVQIKNMEETLVVEFSEKLSSTIDSGMVVLFRPSDSKLDIRKDIEQKASKITFLKEDLLNGRYILKLHWYYNGVKFEVDKPVNVQ